MYQYLEVKVYDLFAVNVFDAFQQLPQVQLSFLLFQVVHLCDVVKQLLATKPIIIIIYILQYKLLCGICIHGNKHNY